MKKFSFFLIVLLLTRVGTTYASPDTTKGLNIQSFFLGSSVNNVNVNQVLALLVGPEGKPGVAGVAGRDGFVGMNGVAGKDGLPGAPGPVGPQGPQGIQGVAGVAGPAGPAGTGVASVILASGDVSCPNGGAKFITADGTSTFACNGAPGANGANGANGATGPQGIPGLTGPGVTITPISKTYFYLDVNNNEVVPCPDKGGQKLVSGDGIQYVCNGADGAGGGTSAEGQSAVAVNGCSDPVTTTLQHHYDNKRKEFFLDSVTLLNVNTDCLKDRMRFTIYLQIKDSPIFYSSGGYAGSQSITCYKDYDAADEASANTASKIFAESTRTNKRVVDLKIANPLRVNYALNENEWNSQVSCKLSNGSDFSLIMSTGAPLNLTNVSSISTRDLSETIAFEFVNPNESR